MRIAIVMPLAEQRGGAELALTDLLRHGRDLGVAWHVVFLEDGPMVRELTELGVTCTVVEAGRMRQVKQFWTTCRTIADVLRKEHIDLVFGWMTKAHLYGGVAALMAGVPAAWFQHGLPKKTDWLDRIATLIPARRIVTCSQFVGQAQRQLYPERPISVVYPAVDLDRFDPNALPTPAEARARLDLPPEGPLIGIVARLQRWKGVHTLVAAMPAILEHHPDARAVVVGGEHSLESDYPAFVQQQIEAAGVQDAVLMVGLQRNVPEWMQACDVLVHASDREPFGIVVVEAMALGKPLVAGASGGPLEVIEEGVSGRLAAFEDAEALAREVLAYLDDSEQAARIGAAARERAHDFSPRRYAERFVEAARAALGQPTRHATESATAS